jgi:hypothetical protein
MEHLDQFLEVLPRFVSRSIVRYSDVSRIGLSSPPGQAASGKPYLA